MHRLGRKYDKTITNTLHVGSNKIQHQVLQEGHGDVPKVGDRVGATGTGESSTVCPMIMAISMGRR